MELGSVLHHFRVTRVRELKELEAKLWEMEHEETGAQLAWLERREENKCFSIAFKTIPENDTGVFHILEHSVLSGSDKYPVREPFVELLKSSVQTFLNALTYPDKTVYPFSSRNDKDFLNLLGIYLDAVLHPAIYHKPEIFRQEGWRYEFPDDETPVYQGVVYNEMKGDMASPYSRLYQELGTLLAPDNCYRFNSGGDPRAIPDLSYEAFIANHKKFYHPSNARISLVGSIDLDAVLGLIDSVLSGYGKLDVDFTIPRQQPVRKARGVCPYEIGPEEPENERAIVAGAVQFAAFDEQKKNFAAAVLADYLGGDNEGPLKKAILEASLGQELIVDLMDDIQQSMFLWAVFNTDAAKEAEIRRTVRETIDRLLAEGLDRERLEACVNRFAFKKRDRDGRGWPRSLDEALSMYSSWLYGGDPAQALLLDESLEALRSEMDGDFYLNILRELFPADAPELLLVPSKTLGEERRAAEAARAAAEAAAWTDEERAARHADAEKLARWQQTPDSPEALATIPMLQLSDLAPEPAPLSVSVEDEAGVPVLRHLVDTGILYARLHFKAGDLSIEELPALKLLCQALGQLGTERYSAAQLQTKIKQKLGALSFSAVPQACDDVNQARISLSVRASLLPENRDDAIALIGEILNRTQFNDRRALGDILRQAALTEQMMLASRGNRYASLRAAAQSSAYGAVREALNGYSYGQWLKARAAEGDEGLDALLGQLRALTERIFTRERLTLSFSKNAGEARDWSALAAPGGVPAPEAGFYPTLPKRSEGILIPADVGFAAAACNTRLHGRAYSGSRAVLSNILTFEYLWSEVRVQGGAYGCGFESNPDGEAFFYSYRDPKPARTLGVFDGAADFLRAHLAEEGDLTRFILGSVSAIDPLLSAEDKIDVVERLWFRGENRETRCRRYRELLSTTREDLLELCGLLDELKADRQICVVGGQAQLDACGDALDEILRG